MLIMTKNYSKIIEKQQRKIHKTAQKIEKFLIKMITQDLKKISKQNPGLKVIYTCFRGEYYNICITQQSLNDMNDEEHKWAEPPCTKIIDKILEQKLLGWGVIPDMLIICLDGKITKEIGNNNSYLYGTELWEYDE